MQAEVRARAWESTSDRLAAEANTITDLLREIQQRRWRVGLGEGTEADDRTDMQADVLRRYENRYH
jgi:hypothetical protein